jgi:hypothetical protein
VAKVKDLGARDEQGRLIGRPFIDTIYERKRVRAVGAQIVFRPPQETKHEFFVHVLANTLGNAWKEAQDKLAPEERHPIITWGDGWDDLRRDGGAKALDRREEQPGIYSSTATGDALALIALAYDMYTLRHAMVISPDDPIVKRLGNRDQFQGVRYELAVAAIFVRAGYEVEWLTDTSRKLPEFIARREGGGVEIAVEAKSRSRPGVLGRPGGRPDEAELKADLSRLFRDALKKETGDRPLVIFLDLNLPLGGERTFQEWIEKLHDEVLASTGEASAERPDPYSAVVFTNFSWHWDGDNPTGGAERFLALPVYPNVPLPDGEADRFFEAINQYGSVPEV